MLSGVTSSDVPTYPDRFDEPINQRSIWIPVGYLPHIRIGDVWQDGSLFREPDYSTIELKLRIFPEHTRIIKSGVSREENSDFILPFERHPFHKDHTNSYCLMVENEKATLIIPSTELIRFYFGSSSNLIARLFAPPFEENKLWTSVKQDENNITHIGLAPGISGYSAADVSRIALNETAKRAARLVSESCMAAAAMREKVYPKAIFPFFGETILLVSGIWLYPSDPSRKVFLVFRILSCSHPFPFGSLRYTMEKKSIAMSTSDADSANDKGTHSIARSDDRKKNLPLDNHGPSNRLSKREISIKRYVRFPDLAIKTIRRMENESPLTVYFSGKTSEVNSLGSGEGGSGKGRRAIDLVDANQAPDPSTHPLFNTPFWEMLYGLVEFFTTTFHIVQFIQLDTQQKYPQFTMMPRIVNENGEIHPWCNIESDGKGKARARYLSILRYGGDSTRGIIFLLEAAMKNPEVGSPHLYMCTEPADNNCNPSWFLKTLHHALWEEGQVNWIRSPYTAD